MNSNNTPSNSSEEGIGCISLIVIGITIYIGWLAWPIIVWLICASVLLLVLHNHINITPDKNPSIINSTLIGLYGTGIYLTIGLAIATASQVILSITLELINEDTIRSVELTLSRCRRLIDEILGLKFLAISLVSIFFVSVIINSTSALNRYLIARNYITKTLAVLVGMTSFSYFAYESMSNTEKKWILELSNEVDVANMALTQAQAELVATTLVSDSYININQFTKRTIKAASKRIALSEHREEVLDHFTKRINKPISDLSANYTSNAESELDEKSLHLERIEDVNQHINDAKRTASVVADIRQASTETLITMICEGLPENVRPITKSIIESIIGSVVEVIINNSKISGVTDTKSARAWARSQLDKTGISSALLKSIWSWHNNRNNTEHKTIEEGVDYEVSSLEREIEERRQIKKSNTSTEIYRPPSYESTYRSTYRARARPGR